MISTDKIEQVVATTNDSNTALANKQNKWNEQPHIGKYKLIKTIGKGNFAKVKLAQHVTTGKKVAVKVIDKTALNTSSLSKLFREVRIMKTLDHPNIVKLFEVIESERHVYLVMEYAPKGEVFDYLVQNGRMKEKEARQRFREIVSAIQYCHQKNIVHRDLKAENLLLGSENQIKIADFGFANMFDSNRQLDTFCGSPPYAAPELFQGRKYDGPEVDVWSLGVILYTLVSGSLPFDGHNMRELRERVLRGKYRIPFYMTTDCEMLLRKMLVVIPKKRYRLLDVMSDKWINQGYEESSLQPYKEPLRNYDDANKIAKMEKLGFTKEEVYDSLYNAKFNNVTATYLLLDYETNGGQEPLVIANKSDSISSLKNVSSYQNPVANSQHPMSVVKENTPIKYAQEESGSCSKGGIARSGSAVETKKIEISNGFENNPKNKSNTTKLFGNGTKVPSATSSTASNSATNQQEQEYQKQQPTPIRIHGFQPPHKPTNNQLIIPTSPTNKQEPTDGDNLQVPNKSTQSTLVKRNNTFTYADKNITSEIESRPVTRTKNMMNMLSHVTPATIPIPIDQPNSMHSGNTSSNSNRRHHANDMNSKTSKTKDRKGNTNSIGRQSHTSDEASKSDSVYEQDMQVSKTNEKPSATGDRNNVFGNLQTGVSAIPSQALHVQQSSIATGGEGLVNNSSNTHTPNTLSSNDSNILLVSSEDTDIVINTTNMPQPLTIPSSSEHHQGSPIFNLESDTPHLNTAHNTNDLEKTNDQEFNHSMLNKPRQFHSNSLFRSFTSKISSNKLIRRLTSHNPPTNRNKQPTTDMSNHHNNDPWTPMDTSVSTNDRRKISASSDLTAGDKHISTEYNKGHNTMPHGNHTKQNQVYLSEPYSGTAKPRVMHLLFRKSITSKLPPQTIINETYRYLCNNSGVKPSESANIIPTPAVSPTIGCGGAVNSDLLDVSSLELTDIKKTNVFVIECCAKLRNERGGNESIQLEIEVFRLSRSSTSFGIRIKKINGSSTRFKAIHKILINKLTPILCSNNNHNN